MPPTAETELMFISCGCVWDGETRIQSCPAHARNPR
jgi:hypothetical protein